MERIVKVPRCQPQSAEQAELNSISAKWSADPSTSDPATSKTSSH